MKRLSLDKLGSLKPGEVTAELRFINTDGETEVWMVEATDDFLRAIRRSRDTSLAYVDDGIDIRIANQKRTIERLLEHVKFHCPLFIHRNGTCKFRE